MADASKLGPLEPVVSSGLEAFFVNSKLVWSAISFTSTVSGSLGSSSVSSCPSWWSWWSQDWTIVTAVSLSLGVSPFDMVNGLILWLPSDLTAPTERLSMDTKTRSAKTYISVSVSDSVSILAVLAHPDMRQHPRARECLHNQKPPGSQEIPGATNGAGPPDISKASTAPDRVVTSPMR